jgi:hypothetical protein
VPRPSLLEELIHAQAAHTVSDSVRLAIEQIAIEIAKEALNDEEFRHALRAQVRAMAQRLLADLGRSQPDRRRPEPADDAS